ncbi:MAG: acetoin utilization protein AcuC [Gammaproteobacteria bacterium]|nr:acetoin utilization protein AcuC [Gammaproteobacteria bacterium]
MPNGKPELIRTSAHFIFSERYRNHSYGSQHPLSIPRVSLTYDLIQAYAGFQSGEVLDSKMASDKELLWFHTPEYIAAMKNVEATGKVQADYREKHNVGNYENPYFPGFFSTPATATGGSIQAAESLLNGHVAFSPAGGMHHAMPDRANGFCFFNDPVLAITRLCHEGLKVLYVDIDAHHGDGVEFAFRENPAVTTFSIHMGSDYAYPFKGGQLSDVGSLGNAINLPLPKGTADSEYNWAFEHVWEKILSCVEFDAVVLQAGTDILKPDPLGKFSISTQQFLKIVQRIKNSVPKKNNVPQLVVLGGGGYHPLSLARCWLGVWGVLTNQVFPAPLPDEAKNLLQAVDWDMDEDEPWFDNLFISRLDQEYLSEVGESVIDSVESLIEHHPLFR